MRGKSEGDVAVGRRRGCGLMGALMRNAAGRIWGVVLSLGTLLKIFARYQGTFGQSCTMIWHTVFTDGSGGYFLGHRVLY